MDRRVIKTKKAIKNAFFALLTEQDINDISVTDIAKLADINRKTFYNYYTGVFQLVDELEEDMIAKFQAKLNTIDVIECLKQPITLYSIFDEVIGVDDPFLKTMISCEHASNLFGKFEKRLITMIRDEIARQLKTDPASTEYVIHFILAGEISAYKSWVQSGRAYPVNELSDLINRLSLDGVRSLVKP